MIYYTINVARYGHHCFATAERSIPTLQQCKAVLAALLAAFPGNDGYSVTVSEHTVVIRCIDVEILLPTLPPVWRGEPKPDAACPGCGCEPGDGTTAGCTHPDGCGFFAAEETARG